MRKNPEDVLSFSVNLLDEEMLLLDGRCSPDVQTKINLLKRGAGLSGKHNISLRAGYFVAKSVDYAQQKGRLAFRRTSMLSCPVTGQKAEYRTPTRKTRENPYKSPVQVPFTGYELADNFVVMENYPALGISHDGFQLLKAALAEELMTVRAVLPEAITGYPPRYKIEDVLKCSKCGWEGHEGLARSKEIVWSENRTCPVCGAFQRHSYQRIFERVSGRFEVVEVPDKEEKPRLPPVAPRHRQMAPDDLPLA